MADLSFPRFGAFAAGCCCLAFLGAGPVLAAGMLDTIRSSQEVVVAHRDASVPFS